MNLEPKSLLKAVNPITNFKTLSFAAQNYEVHLGRPFVLARFASNGTGFLRLLPGESFSKESVNFLARIGGSQFLALSFVELQALEHALRKESLMSEDTVIVKCYYAIDKDMGNVIPVFEAIKDSPEVPQ